MDTDNMSRRCQLMSLVLIANERTISAQSLLLDSPGGVPVTQPEAQAEIQYCLSSATEHNPLTCCQAQGMGPDQPLGYCWT